MILEFYLAASLPLFFLLVFLEGGQRRVLAFLAWGLTAAVISYYINYDLYLAFASSVPVPEVTIAPIVEEFMKALPLFVLLLAFGRRYSKEPARARHGIGLRLRDPGELRLRLALRARGAGRDRVRGDARDHDLRDARLHDRDHRLRDLPDLRLLPPVPALDPLRPVHGRGHAPRPVQPARRTPGFGRLLAIDLPLLLFVLLLVAYNWEVLFPKPAEDAE